MYEEMMLLQKTVTKRCRFDISSAHFQHTKKRGYPPPFYIQIYRYIPLTQRRGKIPTNI